MPNPKENRDEARQKYIDFLASIGIEAPMPAPAQKARNVIPRDQYPSPVEIRETEFDTFVAFDLETTGRSSKIDSIIEIGAVKVSDGQVVETAEFTFQELVKPLDHKKVSPEITKLTGITNEEVYAASVSDDQEGGDPDLSMWQTAPRPTRRTGKLAEGLEERH